MCEKGYSISLRTKETYSKQKMNNKITLIKYNEKIDSEAMSNISLIVFTDKVICIWFFQIKQAKTCFFGSKIS